MQRVRTRERVACWAFQSSTRLTSFATAMALQVVGKGKVSILYEANELCNPLGPVLEGDEVAVSILYEANELCNLVPGTRLLLEV